MRIWYFKPEDEDMNLGRAYNDYMNLVPNDDDWACLHDRDVCFIQDDYAKIIRETIKSNPQYGLFTCVTNRVGNKFQCHNGIISDNADFRHHIEIGKIRGEKLRTKVVETKGVISGMLMLVQKKTWDAMGGAKDGLLGVDNDISKRVMELDITRKMKGLSNRVGIMAGLYVWHTYRLDKSILDKSHLLKTA